jgi:hypothetical protein
MMSVVMKMPEVGVVATILAPVERPTSTMPMVHSKVSAHTHFIAMMAANCPS